MATLYEYCDSTTGIIKQVSWDPDDPTGGINGIDTLAACTGEEPYGSLPPDSLLDEAEDDDNFYELRTKITNPFAYLVTIPKLPCSVTIHSVDVGNASNESASDGSIVINAISPYARQYSINNGLTYQSSNTFTNLTPGTYPVRVRSQHPDGTFCFDTESVEVGFNAIANCELALGNITVTHPTTVAGSDGTITINTITDPLELPVEYRIDSGAWQDSNEFTGLTEGTKNVQVRYKDFTSCGDDRDVILVDEGTDCDLHLEHVVVTHEQSQFGNDGALQVIASSSNGPIEYSIDDGENYQSSNLFTGVAPGSYTVRVKDAATCEDASIVVVQAFKAPYVRFPRVAGLRFVITSEDNSLQSFDNTLFRNMRLPGVSPGCYDQLRQTNDPELIQFLSNYNEHTVTLHNADTDAEVDELIAEKKKDFTRQTESDIAALLADAGGSKTQVFFENGLPDWAKVGQTITLDDTSEVTLDGLEFVIQDIQPGVLEAEGYVALIIDVAFPGSGIISGTVDVEYDIEPFDVWEFAINWGDYPEGRYYVKVVGTDDQFEDFTAESEPVDLAEEHAESVLIRYRNNDNAFQVYYDTGIEHMLRVPGIVRRPSFGGTVVIHEQSDGIVQKLYEEVTRSVELFVEHIPPYLAEKLTLAAAHDGLVVNGVSYVKGDDNVEVTYFDDVCDPLCNALLKLRESQFIAENSDDSGDVDNPDDVLGVNGALYGLQP